MLAPFLLAVYVAAESPDFTARLVKAVGCSGSLSTNVAAHSFKVKWDSFYAATADGKESTRCQAIISIDAPLGWQFTVSNAVVESFSRLHKYAHGELSTALALNDDPSSKYSFNMPLVLDLPDGTPYSAIIPTPLPEKSNCDAKSSIMLIRTDLNLAVAEIPQSAYNRANGSSYFEYMGQRLLVVYSNEYFLTFEKCEPSSVALDSKRKPAAQLPVVVMPATQSSVITLSRNLTDMNLDANPDDTVDGQQEVDDEEYAYDSDYEYNDDEEDN